MIGSHSHKERRQESRRDRRQEVDPTPPALVCPEGAQLRHYRYVWQFYTTRFF